MVAVIFTREEISKRVQQVIIDSLGVDEEEVTPHASLSHDLGAESIDWLDIVFRLEKSFTTDLAKPFKIPRGELFPEFLTFDYTREYVDSDGYVTPTLLKYVHEHYPNVDLKVFEYKIRISFDELRDYMLTVAYIEEYIAKRLEVTTSAA